MVQLQLEMSASIILYAAVGSLIAQEACLLISIPLLIEFTVKLVRDAKVEGNFVVFTNNLVYFKVRKPSGCGLFAGLNLPIKWGAACS